MKKLLFVTSILFAAACGGKSDGETMDPCKDPCKDKPGAMTCDGMADAVAGSMTATGDMSEDAVASMRGVFADQCGSTAWSQETIDCMGAATNEQEGDACAEGMSEEQRTSFTDAMGAAMEGMDGGGGEEGME